MLNVFKKLRLSLLFFDPTEETSGIAGETFWKFLCLMTGERGIMEKEMRLVYNELKVVLCLLWSNRN